MRTCLLLAVAWLMAGACSVEPVTFTPDGPGKPAPTCSDGEQNGDETDVDCGGACAPCGDGETCGAAADCTSGVCETTCQIASCTDGVRNGDETAQDCGGSCGRCTEGATCAMADDCISGVCDGTCQIASCTDGVRNGAETDEDCGGATCQACAFDRACLITTDCASAGVCDGKICRAARSCAELHAQRPDAGSGPYVIQPSGVATPYGAYCDMRPGDAGWTLLLKSDGDATFGFAAAAWTNEVTLAADDLSVTVGNAKYPAFVSLPVSTIRGELNGTRYDKAVAAIPAVDVFRGAESAIDGHPFFEPTWSTQPHCQKFGINLAYATPTRFGWTANQEDDCVTNDTGVGLGVSSYGAGFLCGSTDCSLGNVSTPGHGWLWGK